MARTPGFSLLISMSLVATATMGAQARDSATLQPVVVTATRLPTAASAITQPVTVLSGADLRARGVTTVAAALREVPGASVVQTGSYGSVTSLFLRGGESRYTKVLVDGTPVNAVGGIFFFENLSLDNVERIEVVAGPSSALYGADAMSGVVQIFTRRGSGPPSLTADFRSGSYNSHDATFSLGGGTPTVAYSLGAGWHATDGVSSFNNSYNNGTLSGSLALAPDALTSVQLTSRYTSAVFHYPTDFAGVPVDTNSYNRQHRLVLGLEASRQIANGLTFRVIGADNEVHDLSEDTQPAFGSTASSPSFVKTSVPGDGYRRSGEARVEASVGAVGTLTGGVQYQVERERSRKVSRTYSSTPSSAPVVSAPGSDDDRTTRGYYVSVQGAPLPRVAYDASARHDNHSDFHGVNTYHGGVSIATWAGARIRASYGTGFNAPAFYETQGSAYNRPNANLQPEQAHALDVAVEQNLLEGRVHASFGVFDQRFGQLIQYVAGTTSGPPNFTPIVPAYYDNLTSARSRGYQGEARVNITDELTATGSYTQTIAKAYAVPSGYGGSLRPGDALLRRPTHSGNAMLAYSAPARWSASAAASYVGRRPDVDFAQFPSPTVTLPSYVKLDLAGSVTVLNSAATSLALTARADNVLDRRYEDVLHFRTPRRALFVGARLAATR